MRAAIMRDRELVVDEIPDPRPRPGQILVRTLACGICGSDLHALRHGDDLVTMAEESSASLGDGFPDTEIMDLADDVVMGHEFAAEVVALGPGATTHAVGEVVTSMPIVLDTDGIHPIGYSNRYPGGYGELMVLSDPVALHVPDGVDPVHAAMTEPMAVGLHAVVRSGIGAGGSAVVLGCGPIGLAVIAALSTEGIEPIVAADPSPVRRRAAGGMGAHEVVDPDLEPAIDAWRRIHGTGPMVLFEAVGVPGMIDQALREAPRAAKVVVVGVCMEPDTIRPVYGTAKELSLEFVFGSEPAEFAETLRRISEGEVSVAPLITGSVDIAGVPDAFATLASPSEHVKIVVEPLQSR